MAKKAARRIQFWFTLGGLALLAILLYSNRQDLGRTVDTIAGANPLLVLLLPVLQACNFFVVGKYYQSMLALFGKKMGTARMWGFVAAVTFVSQILPSGGMSGLAYMIYGLRKRVSGGMVGLMQVGRYVMSLSSYFLISPLVVLLIIISGSGEGIGNTLSRLVNSTQAQLFAIGFLIIILVMVFIFSTRKHSVKLADKIEKGINRVLGFFNRHRPKLIKQGTFSKAVHDFHDGFEFIRAHGKRTLKPFGYMFLNTFFELTVVYVAFEAVGGGISVGVLFISFLAAQVAGVVSVIPGDVGVHESIMILMLSSFGVDSAIAISATLLYRVFNKIIYLPIGFFFYNRMMAPAKQMDLPK